MRMAMWSAVSMLALLVCGSFGSAQSKKDSLFGELSAGDPAARKVIESLCDDTKSAMRDLIKAASSTKPEKTGSVDLWNRTLSKHVDLWNEKTSSARKSSRGAQEGELGGPRSEMMKGAVKSWPADWRAWGDVQYKFFSALSRSDFIDWRHDVNKKIHGMNQGLEQDPGKFEEVRKQLQWVVDEIKDSRQKVERAETAADIEKEVRRFTRIWTLTVNLERTMKARKKYVEGFFSEEANKPSKIREGYEKAKKFFQESEGKEQLDPMCKEAAAAFGVQAALALESYEKKYEEVRKLNAPVLDESLFDKMPGFQGDGFELVKSVERFESWLHDRQDALR